MNLSNRLHITRTKFTTLEDGAVSYGYLVNDDYASDYASDYATLAELDAAVNSSPESIRSLIKCASPSSFDDVVDTSSGVVFDGDFIEWDTIYPDET